MSDTPRAFDLLAVFRAELEDHRRRLLDDVDKIVRTALTMMSEKLMTRAELAEYLNVTPEALATRWCRARALAKAGKGTPDPIESLAVTVSGSKRWRKSDVDAVLSAQKGTP